MEITTTALHCTNHLHQIILTPLSRPTIASQFCFPMMRTRASLSRFPRPLFRTAFTITCFAADANASFLIQKKATDVSPALKGTSIFLVGMNSSIKTCLGKLLAETLRYYYFDSDSLVEDAAGGKSAFKSFKETDEQGFRESETEVLKQLSSMGRLVVCAGNGAVQSSTNLALLRHGISIWIDVPLDMVASGMMEEDQTEHAQVVAQLGSSYEELRDGYATADATVSLQNVACQLGYDDLNAVTPEDMTLEVLKEIERLTRVKKMMEEAATPF
ncbi:Shikimate kinase [Morus notabilis]|uniref:Shikimate kinase n=1 Tax=Morus notabilis TaxID=981085 RepID=W9SEL9_9ROSA|nr:Shikimate kinase [Morus notabilis]